MEYDQQTPVLLLVEDDAKLAALMQEYLGKNGFQVLLEPRGDLAPARILHECPDLVLLDIMLPGKDGFAICREIRPHYSGPVMMLTARDDDLDELLGLELGADDYISKPVQPRLLLARIRAVMRRLGGERSASAREPARLVFEDLEIDAASREARLQGNPLSLTTAEFDLLWLLASHAGAVLSRDDILRNVRGIGYDGTDRSIDLRISRLRKKLGDDSLEPRRIKTVRGAGYLFVLAAS
ncbi:MAG TPA: winged helix-turn-helix domain-containing protein [Gammaproteobacteria bacterium]